MGNCISWDRNKSIWAVRILSEVLLCTGIVACVAAFTIEVSFFYLFFDIQKITQNTREKYPIVKSSIFAELSI